MKRTSIFGALFLAVLALCACGGNDEFVYKSADVSWLSEEELAKTAGEIGESCTPQVSLDCYGNSHSAPSTGCNRARTQILNCEQNENGEWRYTSVNTSCRANELCLIRQYEFYVDGDGGCGGGSRDSYGECRSACAPGTPDCIVAFPYAIRSSTSVDCVAQRENVIYLCKTNEKGQFIEDGAPLPSISGSCKKDEIGDLWPELNTTSCNRCIKTVSWEISCEDGYWHFIRSSEPMSSPPWPWYLDD